MSTTAPRTKAPRRRRTIVLRTERDIAEDLLHTIGKQCVVGGYSAEASTAIDNLCQELRDLAIARRNNSNKRGRKS
jgi:TATA-box binding protein (TBP) (component of TFIID and TFIIIB)